MKKNLFYYLFAVICSVALFTSCSDDDDKVVSPVGETTFTDANGLALTYSGVSMLGKKVTFTPNAADATKATLTLSGLMDLSSILRSNDTPAVNAPGVIPGETTTTLNVENMIIDGDKVVFEGTEENNGRSIKYSGEATSKNMNLALEVTMPSNVLSGTSWDLAPTGTMFEGDPMAPIHVKWDADEFPFGGSTWDINSAISLIVSMTQIEGKSIPQLLSGVLNKVTFLPDGNIQAEYKNSLTDTEWKTSELNIATYTVSNNKIYLFLNLSQIMSSANKNRDINSNEILGSLIPMVLPMLSNGIPMTYVEEEDKMSVYLDTETLLPILQVLAPMFENEEFVTGLVDMLKEQAGDMGALVDAFLKPVLVAIPQIVSTTKTVQIGLKLVPATE